MNINPAIQTTAAGSFKVTSEGVIVGTAFPDPETRFALAGGYLASTETLPMWGGVAITNFVPGGTPPVPDSVLGGAVARATAEANLTGFSVFDQNYAAMTTPQSPVPQSNVGMLVNFYRTGTRARIALEMDPALSLEAGAINAAVGWDFTNQKIIAGTGLLVSVIRVYRGDAYAPVYASGTGFLTWNRTATAAICVI